MHSWISIKYRTHNQCAFVARLSVLFYLCPHTSPPFFIFSDLVNGLILLMNSNFSEPVNIVSIKWIVIVMCYRAYGHVTAQFVATHPIITDRLSRRYAGYLSC